MLIKYPHIMHRSLLFILILTAAAAFQPAEVDAQRRGDTYQSLLIRTDQPASYLDHFIAPAGEAGQAVTLTFRLDYDFIPFLKVRPDMTPPDSDAEYFAPLRMGVEIFEGEAPESRRSRTGALSVHRDAWQDTVWVNSYEETKSRSDYTQGFLTAELAPGTYHYELQLSRAGSTREIPSVRRTFIVPEPADSSAASFLLLQDGSVDEGFFTGTLLNYGSNVLYGQDYAMLIRLPDLTEESADYTLTVEQLAAGQTEGGREVLALELDENQKLHLSSIRTERDNGLLQIRSERSETGTPYALVQVPNGDYENARFLIQLYRAGEEEPVGRRVVNSQWLDMPTSLYNIDVAVDMLRFILPENERRELASGSAADKERKFRQFWAERDPTPETEFNELMAEYYRRIDYAYKNFSSLQVPGYDTDQGQTYILYGPPLSVERRLPPNSPAREVWEYPGRTLIFEATTGFGDFKLISDS